MGRNSNSVRLAKALSHPLRIKILMAMNAPTRRLSPSDFSREKGLILSHSAYHFRKLEKFGFIELVETRPRRGSTEHYYEPVKKAMAWKREWEAMAPILKQNLSATALGGFVDALGECIDAGTFEKRADSHLSWDRARVDEEGFAEMAALMVEILERYLTIQAKCAERMSGNGDPGFIACFALSLFESPPPPKPGNLS
jgi:hypothetical protein